MSATNRQMRSAVDAVVARFGGVDILINNAGIGAQGTVEDNTDEEWSRVFGINVLGIVRLSRAALPHLRASIPRVDREYLLDRGYRELQRAVYSASKGAVLSLTRAMATDHLPKESESTRQPRTAYTPWVDRLSLRRPIRTLSEQR